MKIYVVWIPGVQECEAFVDEMLFEEYLEELNSNAITYKFKEIELEE